LTKQKAATDYAPEEIARRRDAVVKAMIATPPKPHAPLKAAALPRKKDKPTTKKASGKKSLND
jgi:hypothetical protein